MPGALLVSIANDRPVPAWAIRWWTPKETSTRGDASKEIYPTNRADATDSYLLCCQNFEKKERFQGADFQAGSSECQRGFTPAERVRLFDGISSFPVTNAWELRLKFWLACKRLMTRWRGRR